MTDHKMDQLACIKVIGVGGGGGNAINRMVASGVKGVEFYAVNTDQQALNVSLADYKLQIGGKLTKGLGGGSVPDVGERAAKENKEDLEKALEGSDMVFVTAGLGGGTGTGASTEVARIAREMGALTIAVVTKPFRFEGPVRMRQAEDGLKRLQKEVDSIIVIPNDQLLSVVEKMTTMVEAFKIADDILKQGVQGICNLITIPGLINLDFADVRTIMSNSGAAMMGMGRASGDNRALEAANQAISSPLLEETIHGSKGVILNITGGDDLTLHEVHEVAEVIYGAVDPNANILFGSVIDDSLKEELVVTVIATGFERDGISTDSPIRIESVNPSYEDRVTQQIDNESGHSHSQEVDSVPREGISRSSEPYLGSFDAAPSSNSPGETPSSFAKRSQVFEQSERDSNVQPTPIVPIKSVTIDPHTPSEVPTGSDNPALYETTPDPISQSSSFDRPSRVPSNNLGVESQFYPQTSSIEPKEMHVSDADSVSNASVTRQASASHSVPSSFGVDKDPLDQTPAPANDFIAKMEPVEGDASSSNEEEVFSMDAVQLEDASAIGRNQSPSHPSAPAADPVAKPVDNAPSNDTDGIDFDVPSFLRKLK